MTTPSTRICSAPPSGSRSRQLASRGRRRVREAATPEGEVAAQREVVDAFFAAARGGDFDALLAVLDPDVVVRVDGGAARLRLIVTVEGAAAVAGTALRSALPNALLHPVLVNGGAGVLGTINDQGPPAAARRSPAPPRQIVLNCSNGCRQLSQ